MSRHAREGRKRLLAGLRIAVASDRVESAYEALPGRARTRVEGLRPALRAKCGEQTDALLADACQWYEDGVRRWRPGQ